MTITPYTTLGTLLVGGAAVIVGAATGHVGLLVGGAAIVILGLLQLGRYLGHPKWLCR